MNFRIPFGLLILAMLLANGTVRAQPMPLTSSAPAAQKTVAKPPCDPVAILFGSPICRADLHAAPAEPPPGVTGDAAITYEAQRQHDDVAQLREQVWQLALAHRFGAHTINPSAQEIEDYHQALNTAMAASYDADKQTAAYLQDILQKNRYAAADDSRLRHLLALVQTSVKLYEERQSHEASLPKEMQFVTATTEAQVALGIIRAWKGDKALYAAYGGRLVLTPTGLRPIDADRKFLAYIKHDGGLKVIDPAYKTVTDALQASIAAPEPIRPAPPEVQKMYFSSPTWQFQFANNTNRLAALKAQVAKMPVLPGAAQPTATPSPVP